MSIELDYAMKGRAVDARIIYVGGVCAWRLLAPVVETGESRRIRFVARLRTRDILLRQGP